MKSLAVVTEDRVGLLADISYILGKAKINIESLSVDVVGGKAVIILTVNSSDSAEEALRAAGYKVEESNVIVLKLQDQPGELNRITSLLAKEHVSIDNVHILSRDGKCTIIGIVVDKPKKAEVLLEKYLVNKE
ncbi:MAG: ACT domain-containing protein [Candidatus Micrarchaeota archaeon]